MPVAERYKARACDRSPAGITDLNPAGDMDVCVVCCRGTKDIRTEDIKAHKDKEDRREERKRSTNKI